MVGHPDAAAGHGGGTADDGRLFDDQHLGAGGSSAERGTQPRGTAADNDNVISLVFGQELGPFFADDGHRADVLVREAAQVVGQAEHRLVRPLPISSTALHLQVHLVDHA